LLSRSPNSLARLSSLFDFAQTAVAPPNADPVQTVAPGSGPGLSPQVVTSLNPLANGYWVVSVNGTVTEFGDAGAQVSSTVLAKTVLGGGTT
jgi:hypothetical protein